MRLRLGRTRRLPVPVPENKFYSVVKSKEFMRNVVLLLKGVVVLVK